MRRMWGSVRSRRDVLSDVRGDRWFRVEGVSIGLLLAGIL